MIPLPRPSFGDYLRHLRSVSPASRRRSNGRVSRTELAAAADMSAGYLIKLEQGKAGNPSPEVVDRLADALELGAVQAQHLHDLARYRPNAQTVKGDGGDAPSITSVMKEAVDSLHPHLCGYVDEAWNVLYCNSEYARIFKGISEVGNVLDWFFLVPESQSVMVEWEAEARLTVAWFRALMVRRPDNPIFDERLRTLGHSPDFRAIWSEREIIMGRHSPYMMVRDLANQARICVLAQVYAWPDPTQAVQMYLGIRTATDHSDERA